MTSAQQAVFSSKIVAGQRRGAAHNNFTTAIIHFGSPKPIDNYGARAANTSHSAHVDGRTDADIGCVKLIPAHPGKYNRMTAVISACSDSSLRSVAPSGDKVVTYY